MDDPKHCDSLASKIMCSGRGLQIRKKLHQPLYENFTVFDRCGGNGNSSEIESRPCVDCRVITCNECRVHAVYQSLIEKPCPGSEDHWWAGYTFGFFGPTRLLPTSFLASSEGHKQAESWNNSTERKIPQHDKGYICIPFHSRYAAKPESVDNILDRDLGLRGILTPMGPCIDRLIPFEITEPFNVVARGRLDIFCKSCSKDFNFTTRCQCTLRQRYLDRWLCLDCYITNECPNSDENIAYNRKLEFSCPCGEPVTLDAPGCKVSRI